jgi:Arm DNA-binding domain
VFVHLRGDPLGAGKRLNAVENAARSDLIWDDEARGLCVRAYPDGSHSFIFLYRINGRQRFIRLGRSPGLSLKAARTMARQFCRIVDEGRDPVIDERDRRWMTSFDKFLRHIAEHVSTLPSRSNNPGKTGQ